jgi:hypothetical protein
VRVLESAEEQAEVPVYLGVSYCDAVRQAGQGDALRILPGSIQICQWAPVVLGLKEPEDRFEEGLAPRLSYPTPGLLLAPLDRFPDKPQVIIVRATPEALAELTGIGDGHWLWDDHQEDVAQSALARFSGGRATWRHRMVGAVNSPLAALARSARWRSLTQWLFRSRLLTRGFDAIISRALADMSVCRNSTVTPLLTGRANVSYFCTGGITWGRNDPSHLTSGWPAGLPVTNGHNPGTRRPVDARDANG